MVVYICAVYALVCLSIRVGVLHVFTSNHMQQPYWSWKVKRCRKFFCVYQVFSKFSISSVRDLCRNRLMCMSWKSSVHISRTVRWSVLGEKFLHCRYCCYETFAPWASVHAKVIGTEMSATGWLTVWVRYRSVSEVPYFSAHDGSAKYLRDLHMDGDVYRIDSPISPEEKEIEDEEEDQQSMEDECIRKHDADVVQWVNVFKVAFRSLLSISS